MPDDNRFAAIGSGDDSEDEAEEEPMPEQTQRPTSKEAPVPDEPPEKDTSADSTSPDTLPALPESPKVDLTETRPAFEFSDADQKAIYPRPNAWSEMQSTLKYSVERVFDDAGITNLAGRELDEAICRTIANNPQLVVDELVKLREESSQ